MRILVAVDFSEPSRHALACALGWGFRGPCCVDLIHVVETGLTPAARMQMAHDLAELRRAAEAEVDALEPPASRPDPTHVIESHIVVGDPADEIVRAARRLLADFIVIGTRGLAHPTRFLGPVAEGVIHVAPCPVFCVNGAPAGELHGRSWKKLLCPVDFSPTSWHALATAVRLAARLEADLLVAHVATGAESAAAIDLALTGWRRQAEALGGANLSTMRLDGSPAPAILDLARRENFDLIVMGAQGSGRRPHEPMGSVASAVVAASPCPVLAVPPTANRPLGVPVAPPSEQPDPP